jgi:hypothetical protein
MSTPYEFQDHNRFDTAGKNVEMIPPSEPVKRLSGMSQYEDATVKSMFLQEPMEEVPEPSSAKPDPPRPLGSWNTDEEDLLWNLVSMYTFNWTLIAESLLNSRLGGSNTHRTEWCCYNKYLELKSKNFTPHSKGDHLYTSTQTNKKEKKVKVLGMLSTFNYISNLAKKRESAKLPCIISLT